LTSQTSVRISMPEVRDKRCSDMLSVKVLNVLVTCFGSSGKSNEVPVDSASNKGLTTLFVSVIISVGQDTETGSVDRYFLSSKDLSFGYWQDILSWKWWNRLVFMEHPFWWNHFMPCIKECITLVWVGWRAPRILESLCKCLCTWVVKNLKVYIIHNQKQSITVDFCYSRKWIPSAYW
jgi:hypothetical protein